MLVKHFPHDLYGSDIRLLYGSAEEINRYFIRRHGGEPPIASGVRAKFRNFTPDDPKKHQEQFIAVVKERRKTKFDLLASLAHEALHCAVCILERNGIPLNEENDEALTYYFEWLFRLCAREIW